MPVDHETILALDAELSFLLERLRGVATATVAITGLPKQTAESIAERLTWSANNVGKARGTLIPAADAARMALAAKSCQGEGQAEVEAEAEPVPT